MKCHTFINKLNSFSEILVFICLLQTQKNGKHWLHRVQSSILNLLYMREIKFRAWNWEQFSTWWLWDIYSYENINDDWLLTQFTWLLDKNGKEIYEGDVIFERWQNREVIFHKWCFCVRHFEVEDYPLDRNTYHIFSHEHIEVIWNIYENPDLIP